MMSPSGDLAIRMAQHSIGTPFCLVKGDCWRSALGVHLLCGGPSWALSLATLGILSATLGHNFPTEAYCQQLAWYICSGRNRSTSVSPSV